MFDGRISRFIAVVLLAGGFAAFLPLSTGVGQGGIAVLRATTAVHGQTSPPSPTASPTSVTPITATPTATIPSPEVLLARSRASFLRERTVHMVSVLVYLNKHVERIVLKETEDVSYRPVTLHAHVTQEITTLNTSPRRTSITREEQVLVRGHAASRTGKARKWTCLPQGLAPGATSIPTAFPPGLSPPHFGAVASGTIDGINVWRVPYQSSAGTSGSAGGEFDIAQSDFTLRRAIGSARSRGFTERLHVSFSKYGESLHVALPRRCRG